MASTLKAPMDEAAALSDRRPLIYTAGKMSAPTKRGWDRNIAQGKAAALELIHLGYAVVCPHLSAHYEDADGYKAVTWADWLANDLAVVRRVDAVLLLPGWRESKGASLEARVARRNGVPTFETIEALAQHFAKTAA
jgi:hypothetical protein